MDNFEYRAGAWRDARFLESVIPVDRPHLRPPKERYRFALKTHLRKRKYSVHLDNVYHLFASWPRTVWASYDRDGHIPAQINVTLPTGRTVTSAGNTVTLMHDAVEDDPNRPRPVTYWVSKERKRYLRYCSKQAKLRKAYAERQEANFAKWSDWKERRLSRLREKIARWLIRRRPTRDLEREYENVSALEFHERDFVERPYQPRYFDFRNGTCIAPTFSNEQTAAAPRMLPVNHGKYHVKGGTVSVETESFIHIPEDKYTGTTLWDVRPPIPADELPDGGADDSFGKFYYTGTCEGVLEGPCGFPYTSSVTFAPDLRFTEFDVDGEALLRAVRSLGPHFRRKFSLPVALWEVTDIVKTVRQFWHLLRVVHGKWAALVKALRLLRQRGKDLDELIKFCRQRKLRRIPYGYIRTLMKGRARNFSALERYLFRPTWRGLFSVLRELSGADLAQKFGGLPFFHDLIGTLEMIHGNLHALENLPKWLKMRGKPITESRRFSQDIRQELIPFDYRTRLRNASNELLEIARKEGGWETTPTFGEFLQWLPEKDISEVITIRSEDRITLTFTYDFVNAAGISLTDEQVNAASRAIACGMFLDAQGLWDVIPFSFVVDWFVDFGHFFDGLSIKPAYVRHRAISGCITHREIYRREIPRCHATQRYYLGALAQAGNKTWWDSEGWLDLKVSIGGQAEERQTFRRSVLSTQQVQSLLERAQSPELRVHDIAFEGQDWWRLITGVELMIQNIGG
jgi:hypothetical protein